MRRRLLFVFNPQSGKGRVKSFLFDIVDIFTRAGYEVTALPTQCAGGCRERVATIDGEFDIIVVSGGDGTLKEAVSGMLSLPREKRLPIGYIPSGTMNDFASGNGIPKNMTDAAEAVIAGKYVSYDIGSFNGETFIYVAACGAFTDVSYDTPQLKKNLLGSAAYFLEGIKRIPRLAGIRTHIETAEGDVIDTDAFIVLIMNSTSVAGFEISEFYDDIDTHDGLFEIIVIPKTENILDIAGVLTGLKNGETDKHGIHFIKTSGARITTAEPVRWTLDGDFGGEVSEVGFKVIANAVEFVINNKE